MIHRFGGTTAVTEPWPADDEEDDNDRFERLENMLVRSMKRSAKKGGGGASAGVSGSLGSGSHTSQLASEASGVKD